MIQLILLTTVLTGMKDEDIVWQFTYRNSRKTDEAIKALVRLHSLNLVTLPGFHHANRNALSPSVLRDFGTTCWVHTFNVDLKGPGKPKKVFSGRDIERYALFMGNVLNWYSESKVNIDFSKESTYFLDLNMTRLNWSSKRAKANKQHDVRYIDVNKGLNYKGIANPVINPGFVKVFKERSEFLLEHSSKSLLKLKFRT